MKKNITIKKHVFIVLILATLLIIGYKVFSSFTNVSYAAIGGGIMTQDIGIAILENNTMVAWHKVEDNVPDDHDGILFSNIDYKPGQKFMNRIQAKNVR